MTPELELESHAVLDRLRSLSVSDLHPRQPSKGEPLAGLSLSHLESLLLCRATCSDIEQLARVRLRRLTLYESLGDRAAIVAAVAKLDSLEHLGLHWYTGEPVDVGPLSKLARLRRLELNQATGELHAPDTLESVAFRGSGHVRIRGEVPSIDCGHSTIYGVQHHVDLARVETLGLSATSSFVQHLEHPRERLASLETLVLDGAEVHPNWINWLGQLPRLRTVIWPNLSIRQQRAAAERLPHLQILGDTPRLRDMWPPAGEFDPLAPPQLAQLRVSCPCGHMIALNDIR